ncbi:MAG: hypothetical protein AAF798_07780 [Bacteroidota bacterium]
MIKSLLKLAAVLVVGILLYNYFMGSEAEKQQSKEIFQKVKDLGSDAWNLLRAEKDKLDEGKYDGALDQITDLLDDLKEKAEDIKDSDLIKRIAELESQKEDLERKMNASERPGNYDQQSRALSSNGSDPNEEIKRDWKNLIEETEKVMNEMTEK